MKVLEIRHREAPRSGLFLSIQPKPIPECPGYREVQAACDAPKQHSGFLLEDAMSSEEIPAVKPRIEDPCDVRDALSIIKAMGDCLVCIHEVQRHGQLEPFDETIQTIGYLLIEKARCAAESLELNIND